MQEHEPAHAKVSRTEGGMFMLVSRKKLRRVATKGRMTIV
jgi:hypothetical protein